MIRRLREAHPPEDLAAIYAEPHDHRRFGHGHHLRVEATKVLARWMVAAGELTSVADLSCGNGEIALSLGLQPRNVLLGDFAPGHAYTGPLEQTLPRIREVDLYICSETLEHLDDPERALFLMRDAADHLVLTTPIEAWEDANSEHYWAWDRNGVESLFARSGWVPTMFMTVDSRVLGEAYQYGIWSCR